MEPLGVAKFWKLMVKEAVVQVFEDTSGVDNKYTIVQFTGEYKGGAAEGGRRPSIWNIFEQRSTPTPCASFTTCSGPGFLPVVF